MNTRPAVIMKERLVIDGGRTRCPNYQSPTTNACIDSRLSTGSLTLSPKVLDLPDSNISAIYRCGLKFQISKREEYLKLQVQRRL